jgi:hypothetical protein
MTCADEVFGRRNVTLLPLWELRRLRTHFGLTVRGALRQDDRVPA